MILYLDTSTLVKLYTEESGRDEVQEAIQEAETVAVPEIGYVEARSALAANAKGHCPPLTMKPLSNA